jgi:hypothetical protein
MNFIAERWGIKIKSSMSATDKPAWRQVGLSKSNFSEIKLIELFSLGEIYIESGECGKLCEFLLVN